MTEIDITSAESLPARSSRFAQGGFFLMVIALGAAIYFTPIKSWLSQGQLIKTQLSHFGVAAPEIFTLGTALLVAVGVPRLILCSLAGMLFGFVWGLVVTQIGTVLGAYLTFLFVRWRGRAYTLHRFSRLRGFSQQLEEKGLMAVLVVRQLPVNGFYNDILLGLSSVTHRNFLIGTFLGFLPQGVTACLVGAGLIQADFNQSVQYIAIALACSVMLGLMLKWLVNTRQVSKVA